MDKQSATAAVQIVGTVTALGLFLPSIEKAWDSTSDDPEQAYRQRAGETVYLTSTAALTLLASYAYGTPAPFVIGFGLACLIVAMQEHAFTHRSRDTTGY